MFFVGKIALITFLGQACKLPEVDYPPIGEPNANFEINNSDCNAPCEVAFTNLSTDAESFVWDFGDGSSPSYAVNPVHIYEKPGSYVVKLTVKGRGREDFESKTIVIGSITFKKTYGGTMEDRGSAILQTEDGGYLVVGRNASGGGGKLDMYLLKTDRDGGKPVGKYYGGPSNDIGNLLIQTSDGGYLIGGYSESQTNGALDFYLVKTDLSLNVLPGWPKNYGGTLSDVPYAILELDTGGYLMVGESNTSMHGYQFYIVKTDQNGNQLGDAESWGGSGDDRVRDAIKTTDGGFILCGRSDSPGGNGGFDVVVIKLNANLDTIWTKYYGGMNDDGGFSIKQTSDGGFIVAGNTWSYGDSGQDKLNLYLIKIDAAGNKVDQKTYGSFYDENASYINHTTEGHFVVVGYKDRSDGKQDVYFLKVNENLELIGKEKTFGGLGDDYGIWVIQTSDGGFIISGTTNSTEFGDYDIYLIKTDKDGNIQ